MQWFVFETREGGCKDSAALSYVTAQVFKVCFGKWEWNNGWTEWTACLIVQKIHYWEKRLIFANSVDEQPCCASSLCCGFRSSREVKFIACEQAARANA